MADQVDGFSFANLDVSSLLENITQPEENIYFQDGHLPNSTNPQTDNAYYFYEKEQFALLWILFSLIVIGNLSVITALLLSKSRKSRTNFFIMNLALADLSVGLVSVLTDIIWKITVSWNAGNILCKVVRFAQALVTYSSTYVLVALSIDRFDAIAHPLNISGGHRRARVLIKSAWGLSAVFATPSIYLFQETHINGSPQCWMHLEKSWHWQLYMVLVSLVIFIIPAIIIAACYVIIVFTIWSKSKIMNPCIHLPGIAARVGEFRSTCGDEDSRRASSRGLIPKAKIKTVKMTFVIVLVFVLCWSPFIVFDLLQVFNQIPRTQSNIAIATFIQSLSSLNSAANPIIYCLFSTHMCRNLRDRWRRVTGNEKARDKAKRKMGGHVGTSTLPALRVHAATVRFIGAYPVRRDHGNNVNSPF